MSENNLDTSSNLYNTTEIIDSITIARETYFFTFYDNYNISNIYNTNEIDVLKFIYEQIADIYRDNSLINLLYHIKFFYDVNLPEYENTFNIFYQSVYRQAICTDRLTSGIVQIRSDGTEINDSFTSISNNFNQIINNLINPYLDVSNNINNLNNSNLLSDIAYLSILFNLQNDNSIQNVTNLITNIMNQTDETHIALKEEVELLESCNFLDVDKNILEKNSDYCTICQENYEDSKTVKILNCTHFFHCSCIEPWLLNCSNLCPICRKNISDDE